MTTQIKALNDLIFYAIDKASPYALAMHEEDNTLEKIKGLSLEGLSILPQGVAIMWLWINAHSGTHGAKPVSAAASKVEAVSDVINAVYGTIKTGDVIGPEVKLI